MYKTVRNTINKWTKKGISEDWLEELAESYSIDDDGRKATAQYIINAMENEIENYLDLEKENAKVEAQRTTENNKETKNEIVEKMKKNKVTLEFTEYETRELNLVLNTVIQYFREHEMDDDAVTCERLRTTIRKQADFFARYEI